MKKLDIGWRSAYNLPMRFYAKREKLKQQIITDPDLSIEAGGGGIAVSEPLQYGFDDPRRPTPELALRFHSIPLTVDGKPNEELGCLYTLTDFMDMVKHGSVANDDGTGYYAFVTPTNVAKSNQYARPNQMRKGAVDWYWSHVMWYNK